MALPPAALRCRHRMHRRLALLAVALPLLAGCGGSDPNPFASAAEDAGPGLSDAAATPPAEAGPAPVPDTAPAPPVDSGPPPRIGGSFLVSCMPAALGGDASRSLLFFGAVSQSGTFLTVSLTPLKDGVTSDISNWANWGGETHTFRNVRVTDRHWSIAVGEWTIAGTASRFGDLPVTFKDLVLAGTITGADAMCAEMSGQIASARADLTPPGDVCIWVRVADGAALPTTTEAGATFVGLSSTAHVCP